MRRHINVLGIHIPRLVCRKGFQVLVEGGGVFGGDGTETFEWPAVEVFDCVEVDERVEVDYSGVGGCCHAVVGLWLVLSTEGDAYNDD
jgi:hypothetical protein